MTGLDLPGGNLGEAVQRGRENAALLRSTALGAPQLDEAQQAFQQWETETTETRIRNAFEVARKSDPNIAAEAAEIGKQLGIAPSLAESNIDVIRTIAAKRQLEARKLAEHSPVLAQALSNIEFAKIAHDDLDALEWTERNFYAWRNGQLTVERGELWHQKMGGGLTAAQEKRLAEIDGELARIPPVRGFIPNALQIGSQFVASPLPAIGGVGGAVVGGLVAGPPGAAVGFGLGFQGMSAFQTLRVESGNWYGDALQKGMDPETAKRVAGYVGLANAALEVVGTRLAAAPIRAAVKTKLAKWATEKVMQQAVRVSPGGSIITGLSKEAAEALAKPTIAEAAKRFAKGYTVGVASETGEEIAQELVNVLGDDAARIFGGQGDKQTWTEALAQVMEVGMKAAQGMALVGVGSPSVRLFMDGVQIREAERAKEFLLSVQETAKQSKTLPRSPVTFERLVAATAKQSNAETVYVDAREFKNVLEQTGLTTQELGQAVPELAEQLSQLDALVQQGGDVTMPTAKWASSISVRPQLSDALLPHMRLSQEAYSPAEAETRVREIAEKVKKQATQTVEDMDARRTEVQEQAEKIKGKFRAELLRFGRLPEQAEVEAQTYRNFVVETADALGVLPDQFVEVWGAKVTDKVPGEQAAEVESPTLFQDGQRRTDTPEFKAWFGESKVVDEKGEPLVVYHGTRGKFEAFRVGSAQGWGRGIYFTDNPAAAEEFADEGGQVMPVYVTLKNPYREEPIFDKAEGTEAWRKASSRWDSVQDAWREDPAFVSDVLRELGYDGVIAKNSNNIDGLEVVAFDPTQIKSVNNRGTWDGRDPNILRQEGDTIERGPARGQFSPIDLTLIFKKDSDASTGWHELSHYFLEVYTRIAMQPDEPASVREDMQVLLDWFGIKDIETWAAMSVEQQAPFHEQFAYNWEKWAFEGRAPSKGLARLFEKMRAFLIAAYKNGVLETIDAIYQRTFKKPLPSLTDEVRGVMGRMVAAEDAVARAEVARDIAPLFQTQEQSGMSDAEWADWQEAQRMAHEAAVTDLTTASLKQMQWLEGARTRVLKQLQKEFKAARAEAKEQAERELAAVPVYRAMRYLKYGELTGPDGERIPGDKDANHKLNTTAVQRIATGGKDTAKLRGMMAKDGLAPDTVAVLFGYRNGAELVNALLDAQPKDDAVQQRATEIVAARQDVVDIDGDPRKVSAFVEMALHNDARARATAVTLRWLEKQGQPVRLYIAGAKLAAKEAMRARKVGDIRPRQHVLAAQRARKDAAKLTQKGQMLDAADAVRRELLQLEMVREANEAREAIDKGLALFDKFRQADEDIGPSRDIDVVEEGRTILKARGLWDAAADAHENLTFDDFQALVAELRGKWDKAKADRNIEIEGRKAAVAEFATEAAEELIARGLPENIADKGTPTAAELKLDDMHSDSSSWARVEHYFRRLDGGRVGPWSRMFQRVSKSMNAYRVAMRKETEALKKIIDGMDTKRPGTIEFTRPDGTVFEFGRGNGGLGKAELLGAIAHSGNRSNYSKMGRGRRFFVVNEDGTVDDTLWRAFIAKMQRDGILTEKDYQGIQAIWDLLEGIKPTLQKTHKALYGYEFEEVEADPVVTPWGVFRGGYIPAMRDRFAVRDTVMTIAEIRDEVRQAMPSAESGFTKSRVEGYARELSLDLAQLTGHLDTTLRWAYVQPVVSDLQRVYNHKNLAGTMERFDRNMRRDILIPWLDRISRGRTTLPGKSKLADGFFRWIRNTSPLAVMFGNIANAMQNFTGLANARAVLGKGHVAHAAWQLSTNPKEGYEFIYGKSAWLNERKQRSIAEHFDDIREALTDQGAWRRGQLAAKKHAYFLQRLTQQPVDAIVWLAAYNKRMSALDPDSDSIAEVEAEAVAYADSVVRETQGSSEVEDISAWEVNTEWGKLLTQFTGWAQNWFQANMNQARTTWEQSANKAQASWRLLGQAWWALFVPAAVGAAIKMLWTGDYGDDDDAYDEAFDLLVAAPTKMALGGVPMVNVVTNAFYNFFFDGVGYNDRLPTAPAISALERAIMGTKGLFENGATGREIRSLGDLATLILGFPISTVAKPIGYAVDVAEGRVQPTGVWDAVRGAITGQASPGSRR